MQFKLDTFSKFDLKIKLILFWNFLPFCLRDRLWRRPGARNYSPDLARPGRWSVLPPIVDTAFWKPQEIKKLIWSDLINRVLKSFFSLIKMIFQTRWWIVLSSLIWRKILILICFSIEWDEKTGLLPISKHDHTRDVSDFKGTHFLNVYKRAIDHA